MKITFLADADFNDDVVKGVLRREPGIDFRGAASAGLRGRTDLEVLAIAGSAESPPLRLCGFHVG